MFELLITSTVLIVQVQNLYTVRSSWANGDWSIDTGVGGMFFAPIESGVRKGVVSFRLRFDILSSWNERVVGSTGATRAHWGPLRSIAV